MSPIIAANLSVAAFNVLLTLIIFGLAIFKVPSPDISVGLAFFIFACVEISVWASAYAATERS